MGIEIGLIGALVLALDIYAIWCVLQERTSGAYKVIWIIAILLFPLFGMLLYFLLFRQKTPLP